MHRSFPTLAGGCVVLLFSALAWQTPVAGQAKKNVWDGVYTKAQAMRGETLYQKECAFCHRNNLLGNSIDGGPPLRGPAFITRWEDQSLEDIVALTMELMPFDEPGTLQRQQYVDVLTFILFGNDIPPGNTELPIDPEALQQIVMSEKPPVK
jgi:cytochrome c